ncbi:hypothetical protein [Nocardia sp. IFM 10818]
MASDTDPHATPVVVDLAGRRSARDSAATTEEAFVCPCGGEWFSLDGRAAGLDTDAGVVALRGNGSVRAYSGTPRCLDCGTPATCFL